MGEVAADRLLQSAAIAQQRLRKVDTRSVEWGTWFHASLQDCHELNLALIPSVGSALSAASFSHTEAFDFWQRASAVPKVLTLRMTRGLCILGFPSD